MSTGIEKMLGLFDATNRPRVIKQLMLKFNFCYEQAEGIWQDAWVVLLTKMQNDPDGWMPKNLESYMFSTCINKALAHTRAKVSEYDSDSFDDFDEKGYSRYDKLVSEMENEAAAVQHIKLQKCALLDLAIESLEEKHRRLICGFYYEKKSMRQLADELGYKDETVAKSTKLRVIQIMREFVRKHELSVVLPYRPASEWITYGKVPA